MKVTLKNLILLPALLLLVTSSFAQTKLGFKTGLQRAGVVSDLSINGYNPAKFISGPQVGLVAEIGFGEHFALQPELNYTPKGFRIQEGISLDFIKIPIDLGTTLLTKVNYLNLPLLAKYKFGNGPFKAYLMAGPEIGYAVNGSFKTKARVIIDFTLVDEKINLNQAGVDRFDAGATLGAGFSVGTGAGDFFMDARYTRSFKNLVEVPVLDIPVKNQGFQVNIGYLFPLGS